MYWQQKYIRENLSVDLNGTLILDLPEQGLLGSLLLRISGDELTGHGQTGGDWRIIDEISKLSVLLNQSTPCKSLTGYQAQALAFYDQGIIPPGAHRNYATNTQFEYILVNFGRWLYDFSHGLDLGRFDNVQLQLSNTATALDFSSLSVSVLGYFLRDAPAAQFSSYFRTEEWKRWTTVTDETIYSNLPTDGLLRRIMLQAIPNQDGTTYKEDTDMSNLMDDVLCALDTGSAEVVHGGIDDILRENVLDAGHYGLIGGLNYNNADKAFRTGLGHALYRAWGSGAKDGAASGTIPTGEADSTGGTLAWESYEGDSPVEYMLAGLAPYHTAVIHFDHSGSVDEYLDTNARKTVKLDIHTRNSASADDGTNAIVLDRLFYY